MRLLTISLAGALTAALAMGQDPPSRVARLNWLDGDVSFQPAGVDSWTAASLNYPLTTGDHIYTDQGARAEMHIGPNAFRLNGQSNFGFLNLDDQTIQVRFTAGSIEIRLRRLDDQDVYEVDTPQGAISLLRTGDYRIDTDPDRNASMVTVIAGAVEVTSGGTSFGVHTRQTAWFSEGSAPDLRDANPFDEFDRFTADRNLREDRIPAPVHVPDEMVGYEDLDAYGVWRNDADYGWIWAPRVEVGWAPYRTGRWAWVEPWGWTWVDEAPWGFAPFHYGRWANVGGGWVWVPGAVVARPVYAPALVAFVGGPRFGVGIPMGAVAWFPLGPRERYVPTYRVSETYVRQMNITHVTNVTVVNNIYVNQRVAGAVTAVPQAAFQGSRPVARETMAVSQADMARGAVVGTAPALAPTRESVLASGRLNGRVAQPPASFERPVVAKVAPPPPGVSFQARQQAIAQNQGRPLAADQVDQIRRQQPAAVIDRAQVRRAPAPAMQNRPAAPPATFAPQPVQPAPAPAVNRPFDRPPSRLDSRPPEAVPNTPRPAPESRPAEPRPAAAAQPTPEHRQQEKKAERKREEKKTEKQ